jgi:hypothetical protein
MSSLSVSRQRVLTQELYQSHSCYHCTTTHMKSSSHTLNLHWSTSCILLYSSLLRASAAYYYCLGILHTYIDAAHTHHRKHMSRVRYPASPLVSWLELQKTVTWPLSIVVWRHRGPKALLQHCWPRVCCGRCLAIDLHVSVFIIPPV